MVMKLISVSVGLAALYIELNIACDCATDTDACCC